MSRKSRRSRSKRPKAAPAASAARQLPLVEPGAAVACEADPFASSEACTPSVQPVELDLPFFDQLPAESWLAHELELRDPRLILKMTVSAARRRAHLAKYVAGVVAVSAVLCLAALVKSAVPMGADDSMPPSGRPAAGSPVSPVPGGDRALPALDRANPASSGDLSGDAR